MTETNQNRSYRPGLEVVPGYTLVRPLGSGMAGDVWVARAAGGTLVAVKVVRSLSKLGGRKEFQALKTLRNIRHPNLCPVHGFWTKDANGQLLKDGETQSNLPDSSVVTFNRDGEPIKSPKSSLKETMAVDGETEPAAKAKKAAAAYPKAEQLIVVMGLGDSTLDDRLIEFRAAAGIPEKANEEVRGLDAQEVIEYLRAASKAIDELNQKHKIYHCDIKPQNILKVGGGIQVCDFGLANRFDGDLRKTQQAFASPAYAAPEVLLGSTYSRTVDQYSLAITYYELRTGVLPFETTTQASVIVAKQNETLDLSHVSPAERKVLRKATKVEPLERYDTCTEFINALALASGVDKQPGITRKRAGLAAALAMALIGGLVYSLDINGDAASKIESANTAVDGVRPEQNGSIRFQYAGVIRTGIENIFVAQSKSPTDVEQEKIEKFAGHWSRELVGMVLTELAGPAVDNASKLNECSDYLSQLDLLYEGKKPILDPNQPVGAALRQSVALAHTQLHLLTSQTDGANRIELDGERVQLLREPIVGRRSLIPALTLALTHYKSPGTNNTYVSDPALMDIAHAERLFANSNRNRELPHWCANRWNFLSMESKRVFNEELLNPRATSKFRQTMEDYYPLLASDVAISELHQLLTKSEPDWQVFSTRVQDLPEMSKEGTRDLKRSIFWQMQTTLEDIVVAEESMGKIQAIFLDERGATLKSSFQDSIDAWIVEIANRLPDSELENDFAQAASIYGAGDLLVPVNSATVESKGRDALEKFLMVAAIRAGSKSIRDGEVIKIVETTDDDAKSINAMLATAIELERDPSKSVSTRKETIDALIDKNSNDGRKLLLSGVRSQQHATYIYTLALGANGSRDSDFLNLAKKINPQGMDSERRNRIARMLLDSATELSSVDSGSVLVRRFSESDTTDNNSRKFARDHILQADRWVDRTKPSSSDIPQRVMIQKLLADIAEKRTDKELAKVEIPDTLNELIRNPPDKVESLGQFYRAVFEIKFAICSTNADRATAGDVNDMLQSAVMMANIAFPQTANSRITQLGQWNQVVFAPAMKVIQRYVLPSAPNQQTNGGWELESSVDRNVVSDFFRFYLLAEEPSSENVGYLKSMEVAAFLRSSDDRIRPEQRVEMLLKASDYLNRRIHAESGQLKDERLASSRFYLDRAHDIQDDNPEVRIRRAILELIDAESEYLSADIASAIDSLQGAISLLEQSENQSTRRRLALYQAHWRLADARVKLAFREKEANLKMKILLAAHQNAKQAKSLLKYESLSNQVTKNQVYLVLGNSCEDLAHYCKTLISERQRQEYFTEGVNAFQSAIEATPRHPLKARYSKARCLYRRSLNDRKALDWLNRANEATGGDEAFEKFKESVSTRTRQEWLFWKAHIEHGLGNLSEAIDYGRRACNEDLTNDGSSSVEVQNETLSFFADLLTTKDPNVDTATMEARFQEAFDKLDLIENPSLETIAFKVDILFSGMRDDELIEFVDNIPQSQLNELREHPKRGSKSIAIISDYLRQTELEAAGAPLTRLLSRARDVGTSPDIELYLQIADANLFVIANPSEAKYGARIHQYIAVFENFSEMDDTVLLRAHRALLHLCKPGPELRNWESNPEVKAKFNELLESLGADKAKLQELLKTLGEALPNVRGASSSKIRETMKSNRQALKYFEP